MIGRKSTLAYANMGVGIVLGLVAAYLVGHYMERGPLGELTTALGFLGILFFMTDLGMGQAHIKRVSEGRDPGDCFATFAVFKLVSTTVFILVALGVILVYGVVLGKPFESTTLGILLVVLVYYVAKSLQEVGQSSFDARLETARSQVATFTDTAVRTGLTILAALVYAALARDAGMLRGLVPETGATRWVAENPGLSLAIATAAGGVAACALALAMLFRVLERGRFRMELLRDYATFALPLFLTSAVGIISQSIDAAALGFFLSKDEAGLFGGVRRLVSVLGGIALPVSTLLFPTMSQLVASRDHDAIQRTMDRAVRYLSMIIVPICAFTAVFGEIILRLFLGAAFVAGALPLAVFCAYVVLITLAAPHINLVLGLGRSGVAARVGLAVALTVIVLNLVLVPNDIQSLGVRLAGLGVMGTALATLASGIVFYGMSRWYSWKLYGYREQGHVLRHLVAAAVMCGILLAVDVWVHAFSRWYDAALFVPLGAAAYFLALLALREVDAEDVRYLKESIHPAEMLRYLKGELRGRRE